MKTATRKGSAIDNAFKTDQRLAATIEWYGGVNYENLRNIIGNIKSHMAVDPEEEITLLVNSYGGATGIGMGFFDTVKYVLKPNLTTIGSGDVDSSGIIVFLSGAKRLLTRNTTLLLHLAGRTFESDKRFSTAEMTNILKENTLKDFQYASIISDATGGKRSPEDILDLMAKNTILTADEAVNLGIAHGIIS